MNDTIQSGGNLRNFALWVIIVLLLLALFTLFENPGSRPAANEIAYSQFINDVEQRRVRSVHVSGNEIRGEYKDGRRVRTYSPFDPTLTDRLLRSDVSITAAPYYSMDRYTSLLVTWLPLVVLVGVWIFLTRRMKKQGP
jgi:cell division protease FtsH